MKTATPFTSSQSRKPITDAVLSLILAVSHFDIVGERAGEKSAAAFKAQQEAQGALYAAIDSEIRRDRMGVPALFTVPDFPAPVEHPTTTARLLGLVDPMAPAERNGTLTSLFDAMKFLHQEFVNLPDTVETTPEQDAALQALNAADQAVFNHIDLMLWEARNVGAAAVLKAAPTQDVPTVTDYTGLMEAVDDLQRAAAVLNAAEAETEEYTSAEAENLQAWNGVADKVNSMLFDAYWRGRRAQAEEEAAKPRPEAALAPVAAEPVVPFSVRVQHDYGDPFTDLFEAVVVAETHFNAQQEGTPEWDAAIQASQEAKGRFFDAVNSLLNQMEERTRRIYGTSGAPASSPVSTAQDRKPNAQTDSRDFRVFLHDVLTETGFHDNLSAFGAASGNIAFYYRDNVKTLEDEASFGYKAMQSLQQDSRKNVRAAVAQFGAQMFLAGLAEGKK